MPTWPVPHEAVWTVLKEDYASPRRRRKCVGVNLYMDGGIRTNPPGLVWIRPRQIMRGVGPSVLTPHVICSPHCKTHTFHT